MNYSFVEYYRIVYHLYIVFADKRNELLDFCIKNGIEAKVHYPVPIYRQKALSHLNYREGDFPITDLHADKIITFPCDQHRTQEELDYIISVVMKFYS